MFDEINEQGLFEGGITLIQPIPGGDFLRNVLNEQEGLYTLIARGREDGKEVAAKKTYYLRNRCINHMLYLDTYNTCAKNPELRFVVSTLLKLVFLGKKKIWLLTSHRTLSLLRFVTSYM